MLKSVMFERFDPIISTITVILSILGFFTLLSTSIELDGSVYLSGLVSKQLVFMLIGIVLYIIISRLDLTYISHLQVIAVVYFITVALLVITLIFGPTINGVQRWLLLPGLQFQPSELAKIVVVLTTAAIYSSDMKLNQWLKVIIGGVAVALIVGLIYMQPHGSMSLMVVFIWTMMTYIYLPHQLRNTLATAVILSISIAILLLFQQIYFYAVAFTIFGIVLTVYVFFARDEWRRFILIAVAIAIPAGIVMSIGWENVLRDYQRERIEVFLGGGDDSGSAFNVNQSMIAIGSGGMWGKGFGAGTQTRLQFLPEHQTDFIFATYAEQFGLIGSLVMISIFAILIVYILTTAMSIHHNVYGSLVVLGLGLKILVEVFINIGTATALIPATGIPLPLISYGGTSVIMSFVALGIIQNVIKYTRRLSAENSYTVDSSDLLI